MKCPANYFKSAISGLSEASNKPSLGSCNLKQQVFTPKALPMEETPRLNSSIETNKDKFQNDPKDHSPLIHDPSPQIRDSTSTDKGCEAHDATRTVPQNQPDTAANSDTVRSEIIRSTETLPFLQEIVKKLGMDHSPYLIDISTIQPDSEELWTAQGREGAMMIYDTGLKQIFFINHVRDFDTEIISGETLIYQLDEKNHVHLTDIQQGRFSLDGEWISGNYTMTDKKGLPLYSELKSHSDESQKDECHETLEYQQRGSHCPEGRALITRTNLKNKNQPPQSTCVDPNAFIPSSCISTLNEKTDTLSANTKDIKEGSDLGFHKMKTLLKRIIRKLEMDSTPSFAINMTTLKRSSEGIWYADGSKGAYMYFDPSTRHLGFVDQTKEPDTEMYRGKMLMYQLDEENVPHLFEVQQGRFTEDVWVSGNLTSFHNGQPKYMKLNSHDEKEDVPSCREFRESRGQQDCSNNLVLIQRDIFENGKESTLPEVCGSLIDMPSPCLPDPIRDTRALTLPNSFLPLIGAAVVIGCIYKAVRYKGVKSAKNHNKPPSVRIIAGKTNKKQPLNSASSNHAQTPNSSDASLPIHPPPPSPTSPTSTKETPQELKTRLARQGEGKQKTRAAPQTEPAATPAEAAASNANSIDPVANPLEFSEENGQFVVKLPETRHLYRTSMSDAIEVNKFYFPINPRTKNITLQREICALLDKATEIGDRNSKKSIKFSGSKKHGVRYKLRFPTGSTFGELRLLGGYNKEEKAFTFKGPMNHNKMSRLM